MTRPIIAASFLAGITAAGLTGRAAMRRWFTVARQVEQAPLEPYLPPRQSPTHPGFDNEVALGEWVASEALMQDRFLRIVQAEETLRRAMPEVGE